MKRLLIPILSVAGLALAGTVGSSYYLLDYALKPDEARADTATRYSLLFAEYPEVKPWVDSLRAEDALRDTFVVMPSGERHHAFYIPAPRRKASAATTDNQPSASSEKPSGEATSNQPSASIEKPSGEAISNQPSASIEKQSGEAISNQPSASSEKQTKRRNEDELRNNSEPRVAVCIHGWRQQAISILHIARIYHQQLGCDVLLPDLHAHGLSEGETIGMGWKEREDVLHWMKVAAELFDAHDFIVHGISMGAATTMNVAGEPLPDEVKKIRFVEDCGYTSVWDEFRHELKADFGMSPFPLLYTSSWLCWLRYGWSFSQAAPLDQVAKCPYPMLLIHGDNDTFVPSWMIHPLYEAKPQPKKLWITAGSEHDRSYNDYTEEYVRRVVEFVEK
ncbi:MAG: alpha/beta hydrolase [Bacteroidaceae bacterium]|nr:alpha/beta hydrolase [Bacteroidaceae bacterium]